MVWCGHGRGLSKWRGGGFSASRDHSFEFHFTEGGNLGGLYCGILGARSIFIPLSEGCQPVSTVYATGGVLCVLLLWPKAIHRPNWDKNIEQKILCFGVDFRKYLEIISPLRPVGKK